MAGLRLGMRNIWRRRCNPRLGTRMTNLRLFSRLSNTTRTDDLMYLNACRWYVLEDACVLLPHWQTSSSRFCGWSRTRPRCSWWKRRQNSTIAACFYFTRPRSNKWIIYRRQIRGGKRHEETGRIWLCHVLAHMELQRHPVVLMHYLNFPISLSTLNVSWFFGIWCYLFFFFLIPCSLF